ncbi:MAG: helix-turn-helix transcriptional regulator, partial [Vallitaleaceae bacterium]|nr:helix-turn-helix transcriptional regulator [Vallitaleaceae bacterium]
IQFSIWSQHKISVTIAISEGIHKLEHLVDTYQKTHQMIQYKMFLGKGKIIFYHDLINKVAKISLNVTDMRLRNIDNAIENKAESALKKEIIQIYCHDIKGVMQYNYIDYMNMFLIRKIIELCEGHQIEYHQIFQMDYIPFTQLKALETVDDIAKWFLEVFEKILKLISPTPKYSRKVQDALQFIRENYGDSQLCLTQIAQVCGTNKVYLSRIFKGETGENLTDYIQNYRIEKAKKLIDGTNYKLYQVAEQVGLQNASQFSVIFKKITGISPLQYKSNS